MSPLSRDRRGFTLIEIMAVFAIVCVLVTLLLPSVMQCREAARRNQCVNNLMQLGVALQQYQNVHEVLPPGVVNATGMWAGAGVPKGSCDTMQVLCDSRERALPSWLAFS